VVSRMTEPANSQITVLKRPMQQAGSRRDMEQQTKLSGRNQAEQKKRRGKWALDLA